MADGFDLLTPKEKDTLRLIGRGHDAKSMARHLGLSVHTVNERLRAARRKLEVTSSREAARLLLERELPQSLGDMPLGDAAPATTVQIGGREPPRPALVIAGVILMSFVLALAAFLGTPTQAPPATAPMNAVAPDPVVVGAATAFLSLVDGGDWDDSYRATASSFRKVNSLAAWTSASEGGRVPLGAVRSRALLDQYEVPAPPNGNQVLRFRTSFANKPDTFETISLVREDGAWRVVGYLIG